MQRINKTKTCFFEKINKIDKPLAKSIKGWREKIQTNKSSDEARWWWLKSLILALGEAKGGGSL